MRQGFYLKLRMFRHRHFERTRLQIFPTFYCTQDCPYCTRHFTGKMTPKENENMLIADQWMQRIEAFPVKIDVVTFSGGEPLLYPEIDLLINSLIDRGYIVTVFSNGSIFNDKIKSNPRLKFILTMHYGSDRKQFLKNCDRYKSAGIRTDIDIMNKNKFGVNSGNEAGDKGIIKPGTFAWKECLEMSVFCYGPDGKLFTSPGQTWFEHVHGEIKKDITWT